MSGWSLRARILAFVVAMVVLPLSAVGVWLARATQRAAVTLVSSELDTLLNQQALRVRDAWANAGSDVRLLAENAPVVRAVSNADSQPPRYVQDALLTMPGIAGVVFRGRGGRALWRIGTPDDDATASPHGSPAGGMLIRTAVVASNTEAVGAVEARVSPTSLLGQELPRGPAQAVIALYNDASRTWVGSLAMPPELLDNTAFNWNNERWIVKRRRLADPPVDVVAAAPVDPVAAPFARSAVTGIAALGVVGIVVVVLASLGARRMTRSLDELAVAADAVARGDFELELSLDGSNEVGRVSRAFNAMRGSVRIMLVERAQRESFAALGELSATIAHQIRTPLTAMRLDLQRVEEMVSGEQAALVQHALSGAERIEGAVAASLLIARSGAPRFDPISVVALVRDAAENARPRAAARGITITLPEDDASAVVRGDHGALVQALTNIFINAVEAARTSVHVSVSDGEDVVIELRDDGPGIPAAELPRVGEPFYSTKMGGTGLGLTIARRVLDAHRGRVCVSSEVGRGTSVRVEMPAANDT